MDSGAPAYGLYDLRAGLFATRRGGALTTTLYTNSAVPVSNGLFTIPFDFGGGFFHHGVTAESACEPMAAQALSRSARARN